MDDHIYWWMMGTLTRCWSFAQWKTCRGIDILHIGFQSGGGVFCVQSPLNSSPQLPSIHTRLHKKVIILVAKFGVLPLLEKSSLPLHCTNVDAVTMVLYFGHSCRMHGLLGARAAPPLDLRDMSLHFSKVEGTGRTRKSDRPNTKMLTLLQHF